MSEDFDIPDLDNLFEDGEDYSEPIQEEETLNYLFVGRKKLFDKLEPHVLDFGNINFKYASDIDEAIDLLLVDIYAIVLLDNESPGMDIITNSRIVRVNHPLAKIVGLSNSRRSLFIADIINHGSIDAYLPLPFDVRELTNIISEQQANHDIDKMLTNFVSSPPELSAASYLLLDPSLSADETEPVKFVGLMVAYQSVPRFSKYFEDLLAKDEILFAGYLSGITMLGQELLQSEDPLKEINFGGISVIFRFYGELQFSIFVRNLSKHNVEDAEEVISEVISKLLEETEDELASTNRPSDESLDRMDEIVDEFAKANEQISSDRLEEKDLSSYAGHVVMFYGTDAEEQRKIEKYLNNKVDYSTISFTEEEAAKEYLRNNEISVLVLDSDIKNVQGQNPLPFADFVKDDYPFTQVIYQMRDRRASSPIIRSLNSGVVNYLISYRATRKELDSWVKMGIEKAQEIREQSEAAEMEGGLNTALAAKTKIRKHQDSYLSESNPILEGVFISENETPVFKQFWSETPVDYDDNMVAGLVASLESVGGEMFYDDSSIGGMELGESNLMVEHREDVNIVFFVKNLGSHNVKLVNQHIQDYADRLFKVLKGENNFHSDTTQARLDTKANHIFSEFTENFVSEN